MLLERFEVPTRASGIPDLPREVLPRVMGTRELFRVRVRVRVRVLVRLYITCNIMSKTLLNSKI